MQGILLVDKPIGPSSFDVVRKIRHLTKIKQIGHAGTLDPLASGLLVICFGQYTKLASYFTDHSKIYDAVFRFGQTSTTDDQEGELTTHPWREMSNDEIYESALSFTGDIEQAPPRYSAVKIDGQRAYTLARKDVDFMINVRKVHIFSLTNLQYEEPDLRVRIHCSKGTYVRSLARDLGEKLLVGAHARAIRRIRSGNFCVDAALRFNDLTKEMIEHNLLQGRSIIAQDNLIELTADERDFLKTGRFKQPIPMTSSWSLAFYGDEPVAIMRKENNIAQIARVFA